MVFAFKTNASHQTTTLSGAVGGILRVAPGPAGQHPRLHQVRCYCLMGVRTQHELFVRTLPRWYLTSLQLAGNGTALSVEVLSQVMSAAAANVTEV